MIILETGLDRETTCYSSRKWNVLQRFFTHPRKKYLYIIFRFHYKIYLYVSYKGNKLQLRPTLGVKDLTVN